MSKPAPLCTHTMTNGVRCGSPAVKGTVLCFHHSAVKTALGKVTPLDQVSYGSFTPIPFVFAEDRAAMQINYFLLLQALNEQRVERRAADLMLRMLRAMDRNLGKSGSLVEQASGEAVSEEVVGVPPTSLRDAGHPNDDKNEAISRVIDEVNASAQSPHRGYTEYREISALHPAGQRVLNMYFERPMER